MSVKAWSFFDSVEARSQVSHIKFGSIPVWPVIRMHICLNLLSSETTAPSGYRFRRILVMAKGFFYGILSVVKPLSSIVISSSGLRVNYKSQYYDRCFERLIAHMGSDRTLLIERPSPSHFPKSLCVSRRLMSLGFFYFLSLFVKNPKISIEGQDDLALVLKEMKVSFNVNAFMTRFYRLYRVFLWFFKLKKPQRIFVTCYYGELAAIIAAKELGIKVIELQHGHLYGGHQAYFPFWQLPQNCIPDEFWAYSECDRDVLLNSSIYSQSTVRVVGQDFLSVIRDNPILVVDIQEFKKHYKKVVCVTSQYVIESQLVEFIREAALRSPDIGYVFIPRGKLEQSDTDYGFESNVKVSHGHNTYAVIQQCDFHATVFSTCAVEAPFLGVPTILIDLDGLSTQYFGEVLTDTRLFCFVTSPGEFLSILSTHPFEIKAQILELSQPFMSKFRVPDGLL